MTKRKGASYVELPLGLKNDLARAKAIIKARHDATGGDVTDYNLVAAAVVNLNVAMASAAKRGADIELFIADPCITVGGVAPVYAFASSRRGGDRWERAVR